jgi:hypothetical protein
MRNLFQLSLILMASVLLLTGRLHTSKSAEQKEVRAHLRSLHQSSSFLVVEKRFVDNGDGTVTDMRRNLMWQKGDNGKEVSFEEAENYCKSLRLGGYTDWRLPNPDERDTALVIELMMRRHSRDAYAFFDLYWSSNPTILLPFNYHPSYGKEISRVYYARERAKAFVRAVRSLGTTKPESDA